MTDRRDGWAATLSRWRERPRYRNMEREHTSQPLRALRVLQIHISPMADVAFGVKRWLRMELHPSCDFPHSQELKHLSRFERGTQGSIRHSDETLLRKPWSSGDLLRLCKNSRQCKRQARLRTSNLAPPCVHLFPHVRSVTESCSTSASSEVPVQFSMREETLRELATWFPAAKIRQLSMSAARTISFAASTQEPLFRVLNR